MITPFRVEVPEADLRDLRERLARTRWPEPATVDDWSQGVPLGWLQDLCAYWRDDYDWRRTEARLNAVPQFRTEIDGLGIHFVHARSPHPGALPLVLTSGWPGSVLEHLDVIGPLTDPPDPADAFHVVCPSLPGFGFSDKPDRPGWTVQRIASAWAELMARLGYDRYGAEGSDWGTSITTCLAQQDPGHVAAIHLVPPLAAPDPAMFGALTVAERAALSDLDGRRAAGSAYSEAHATVPQTIGYALLDSPVALCAWIAEKLHAWAGTELSRDAVLDDVTLYWLTGTGASSARLYAESIRQVTRWFTEVGVEPVTVPTGCSIFPAEVPRPSRRWAERRFPNVVHWGEPERGGHFAALEEPELFVEEVRAVFRAARRLAAPTAPAVR